MLSTDERRLFDK